MNASNPSFATQVAALLPLPFKELWVLWDHYFPRRPERPKRHYLEWRIAYKIEEESYGGLSPETRQRLITIGGKQSKMKTSRKPRDIYLAPGRVLVREWADRDPQVAITAEGLFEYEGRTFKSLSSVARHITGNQWSGPLFFWLTPPRRGPAMNGIAQTKPKRCAVYCRVSSDGQLDQEFNSIDAQKETGHALYCQPAFGRMDFGDRLMAPS